MPEEEDGEGRRDPGGGGDSPLDPPHCPLAAAGGGGRIAERPSCLTLLRSALRNPDQLTAMISNYSTSYNAVNVGIVIPVLNYSLQLKKAPATDAPYSSPRSSFFPAGSALSAARRLDGGGEGDDEQDSVVASSLLAGMIFGQLLGGYLGDVVGRRNAILMVMLLQIGGSLGSAIFVTTDVEAGGLTALEQLAIWRFALGIGAGGVYPLAAVMSAENKDSGMDEEDVTCGNRMVDGSQSNNLNSEKEWNDDEGCDHSGDEVHRGQEPNTSDSEVCRPNGTVSSFQRIALTFSTQGLGFITVPLLAYPLLKLQLNTDVVWRLLLGVGALPGVWVLYLRLCSRGRKSTDHIAVDLLESEASKSAEESSTNNTLEMPSSHEIIQGGEATAGVQTVVSTLFDEMESSQLDHNSHEENENEMALVENSHLDGNSDDNNNRRDGLPNPNDGSPLSLWQSIKSEPDLGRKFAGTAGAWFLFDVLFYGNTLFEPLVLEAAFGSHSENASEELLQTVRDSLVISLLSLPGYFVTVFLIGRRTCVCQSLRSSSSTRCGSAPCFPCYQTPAYIQMQGFLVMSVLYIIIGLWWNSLSNIQWLLLLIYAGTFFFANYGPNTTTFLLPSVTYSEDCRSTLNGISAAAGKMGALLGASVFAPAADSVGESLVMICCGCVSLVAFMLTKVFLSRTRL
ncbi:hypothetical protein ACHAWF_010214 [Thalassiosira exigua]